MEHNTYIGVGRAITKERNGVSREYRIVHFKYKPYSTAIKDGSPSSRR